MKSQRLVAEVRTLCSLEEIKLYLDHLERMAAIENEQVGPDDDEFLSDTPEERAAAQARLAQLKELLTSNVLGRDSGPLNLSTAQAASCFRPLTRHSRHAPVVGCL